jgi:hypothetical protein
MTFAIDPAWPFRDFLDKLFEYYVGGGIQSTGRRLNVIRLWLSMVGRSRAILGLSDVEKEFGWPAPGSADTELGVLMGPEVSHGEAKVYTGVQA